MDGPSGPFCLCVVCVGLSHRYKHKQNLPPSDKSTSKWEYRIVSQYWRVLMLHKQTCLVLNDDCCGWYWLAYFINNVIRASLLTFVEKSGRIARWGWDQIELGKFHIGSNIHPSSGGPTVDDIIDGVSNYGDQVQNLTDAFIYLVRVLTTSDL